MKRQLVRFALVACVMAVLASCGGKKAPMAPPAQPSLASGQGSDNRVAPPLLGGQAFQAATPCETTLTEALAELADLPPPARADEASFRELKAGLREALLSRCLPVDVLQPSADIDPSARTHALVEALESARLVSAAPGEGGRVDDLELTDNGDGTYTLTWTYQNVGDYNQDGIVDIRDIVPLAAHFGESWEVLEMYPPPPAPPYDGNEDGAVDIKDLTPIAANFLCDVAGYAIMGGDSPDGEFTEIDLVRLSPPEGPERIRFEALLWEPECKYFAVRTFGAGGAMGVLSNVVERNLQPVAVAAASRTEGKAPLTVTFTCADSFDPDGTIVTCEWDFDGDGEYDWASPAAIDTQHEFEVESEYAAVLRVTDDDGATATDSILITVGRNVPPVAVAEVSPAFGNEPLTVTFTCADSFDPDGTIVSFAWDFYCNGIYDWESSQPSPVEHTFDDFGTFRVKLRVIDDKGAFGVDVVSIRVNGGPIARLEVNRTEGKAPLDVYFDASESVDVDRIIALYEWDWNGDGKYDDTGGATRLHTYSVPGTYSATVRVSDEDGLTDTDSVAISVAPGDPPTVDSVSPTVGLSGYPLTFIADVDGAPPFTFQWDFGGGASPNTAVEEWPTVTLGAEGTYDCSLTVTNDYGEDTFGFTLEVLEPGPGDWAMFGRDIKHSRMSPYVGPQTGDVKWVEVAGMCAQSSPAIGSDGTLYIGSLGKELLAIGREGMRRWRYTTDGAITSSPAVGADGTVYVGDWAGYLYAINPDGSLRWQCDVGWEVESSPAIADDGTVYVGSNDGYLYAVGPDGVEKWRFKTGGRVSSAPAFDAVRGVVYVGGRDAYIYAISDKVTEGRLKWKLKTGGQIWSSPAIGKTGTIYIGSDDGYLYAVYPSGTLKWKCEIGSRVYSSPGIGPSGIIFVGAGDGDLCAIRDMTTGGRLLWTYETGGDIYSSPAIGAWGDIYIGSDDGCVYCIELDGSLKWSYDIGHYVFAGPVIADESTVYASTYGGSLYALGE